MSSIERSALLPYTARSLFELVNDVEQYPQYLAGCERAEVLERGPDHVVARLHLARHGIRFSFTTRNQLVPWERVDLSLVDGPFKRLSGQWRFETLSEDACKVTLMLQFELANRLMGMAAAKVMRSVAADLVDAMVRRANDVYGGQQ